MKMYEDNELPEPPTQEEIGAAINTLINAAMTGDGHVHGRVDRFPIPGQAIGREFSFHFDLHDTRLCGHDMFVEPMVAGDVGTKH